MRLGICCGDVPKPVAQHCAVCCSRGLLFCMEYLEENLEDWLSGELEGYGDDDYLVFDCPGQVTAT